MMAWEILIMGFALGILTMTIISLYRCLYRYVRDPRGLERDIWKRS